MLTTTENITINRDRTLLPAQDYRFLREEGLAHIRQLCGKLWTDHNAHDPGVTIMELLCYALTDLGYRTDFDIADLLAEPNGQPFENSGLFPAHEILTTCPVTLTDYRKLLLKVEGVRNAWLIPLRDVQEVSVYADCKKGKLEFEWMDYEIKEAWFENKPLILNIEEAKVLSTYVKNSFTGKIRKPEIIENKNKLIFAFDFEYRVSNQTETIRIKHAELGTQSGKNIPGNTATSLIENFDSGTYQGFLEKMIETYFERLRGIELQQNFKPVRINGLYDVLLELEIDNELGALTERVLTYRIPSGKLRGVTVKVDTKAVFDTAQDYTIETPKRIRDIFNWTFNLSIDGDDTLLPFSLVIINDKSFEKFLNRINNDDDETEIVEVLPDIIGEALTNIINAFRRKQLAREAVLEKVCCVLHAHRNLCEDFRNIDTVPAEKVAVCVDIETENDTDLEVLYAEIVLAVENYFNPPIKYYTLSELLDEGYTADEIFDSPYTDTTFECAGELALTKAGFVKTEDIVASELRSEIYASDLINILMDLEGVLTVKNLQLRKYDEDNNTDEKAQKWCLDIMEGHQPVFDLERSKFLFFKNQIPYTAKVTETQQHLTFLREAQRKAAYVEPNQTLPQPEGKYRNLHEYFPLQNDLPHIYGTGESRLPRTAPDLRKAQAKQLKAYLQFYEQVLADYLAQLMNAKRLLSVDENLEQTYFTKYLDNSANLKGLEIDDYPTEYYIENTDAAEPHLKNNQLRRSFYESKEQYQARHNRFLDHLLARFGEQFTDYTLILFNLDGDRLEVGDDLIKDKINFLKDYPQLSRSRFKAFNYMQGWQADNISGIERRIGRLLGIDNITRRELYCTQLAEILVTTARAGDGFVVRFRLARTGNDRFDSEIFVDEEVALQQRDVVRQLIQTPSAYIVTDDGQLVLINPQNEKTLMTYQGDIETTEDSKNEIRRILNKLENYVLSPTRPFGTSPFCGVEENEGMYLFEHILFRPINDERLDTLMEVCLPEGCACCGSEDPYSFQISIVLPYWTGRFNDMNFRDFFERTVREEIPAHIQTKICWINNAQMAILENAYRGWLELKQQKQPDPRAYNEALADLVSILRQLRTVYPKATLHDCEEDGGDNPVRLGSTTLGSF